MDKTKEKAASDQPTAFESVESESNLQSPHEQELAYKGLVHISTPIISLVSALPEYRALQQTLKEVLIWQECLKNCVPYFAKQMVMRLRELNKIDDADAEILIKRLGLEVA